jgi:hypothetical protein
MKGKLKVLGLTFVAALAMSSVAASAASAQHEFESNSSTTYLTATNEESHVFTAGLATVECTHAEFEGTQVGATADTVTVHPEYSGCSFLGNPASVTTTGCNYEFDSDTNATGHGAVTVKCAGASQIKVDAPGACTIYFGSQTPSQGVSYTNLGGDVTVDATVTNVAIAKKEGPLCFLVSNTGTYSGAAIVEGFKNAAHTEPAVISVG